MDRHDALDDHGRFRDILIGAVAAGGYALDAVHDVLPLNDLAEHGIAVAGRRFVLVVQEVVVRHVDEELRRGGVGIVGTGHGDGAALVGKAVVGFVLDGGMGRLFFHLHVHAAALDHESLDHAVEDQSVIESLIYKT